MRTTRGRRLYAFFAVAMAVFIGLMIFTGIVCDGFAQANRAPKISQAEPAAAKRHSAEPSAKLAEAEAATAVAQRNLEAENNRLADFLKEHFTELAKAGSDAADAKAPEPDVKVETPAPVERMIPNPAWEDANRQLADLKRRRGDLLANLTESHPLVRQMEITISDLELQLKKIPERLKAPAFETPVAFTPVPESTGTLSVQAEVASRWRSAEAEYKKLSQESFAAEQAYRLALHHEQAERQLAQQAASTPKLTRLVLASTGGANPQLSILLCGTIAMAAGVLVARKARIQETTFQSAAEVRQSLGAAILGVIPRAPHTPREQPWRESKWVRRAVLGAEVTLAAVVLVLAISSVTDSHFFRDLVADPLAACSNKFWC